MTGEPRYRTIATYFWDQVVHHHSYVIGGNANAEFFGPPDQVVSQLGENTCENTCENFRGASVRLETEYPDDEAVRLRVDGSGEFALRVRIPSWGSRPRLTVNRVPVDATPGRFATIRRRWHAGDVVELHLPMAPRWLPAPDNPAVSALTYGPLVLAARHGSSAPPVIPTVDPRSLWREPGRVEFSVPAGSERLRLSPFLDVQHEHYSVYLAAKPDRPAPKTVARYPLGANLAESTRRRPAAVLAGGAAAGERGTEPDGVDGHVRRGLSHGEKPLPQPPPPPPESPRISPEPARDSFPQRKEARTRRGGGTAPVRLAPGLPANLTGLTVSMWVRVDAVVNSARVSDLGFNAQSYFFLTPRTGLGVARCAMKLGGMEAEDYVDAAVPLPAGEWTHVAVTAGAGLRLDFGGELTGAEPAPKMSPLLLGATQLDYLGRSQNPKHPYLKGAVADFRLYGRAFGETEVRALANGGA